MTLPTIPPFSGTMPSRSDPATFGERADVVMTELPAKLTGINAAMQWISDTIASLANATATAVSAALGAPGPIGSTTPSSGAFTTLSVSSGTNGQVIGTQAGASVRANTWYKGTNSASAAMNAFVGINVYGTDGSLELKHGASGIGLTIAPSGASAFGGPVAVTGALSATGKITTTANSAAIEIGSGTGASTRADIVIKGTENTGTARTWNIGANIAGALGNLEIYNNVAGLAAMVSTSGLVSAYYGLAVTGDISATGAMKWGVFTMATRPVHAPGKTIYVADGGTGAVFQGSHGGVWVNLG